MTASKPSEAAPAAVLETTFVCRVSGAVHFTTQGCTCTSR